MLPASACQVAAFVDCIAFRLLPSCDPAGMLAAGAVFLVLAGGMAMPFLVIATRMVLRIAGWAIAELLAEAKEATRSEIVKWIAALIVGATAGTAMADWARRIWPALGA